MIELCLQNNTVCVYSAADWEKLRKEHRIVGTYLGNSLCTPQLPVSLLPEEAILLVNKQLAKLVEYPKLLEPPLEAADYNKLQEDLLEAEQKQYKENRRNDLEQLINKIIEGKRKKGEPNLKTREEILEAELNKSCDVTEATMIWPILTEPLPSVKGVPRDVTISKVMEQTTSIKCAVFADLWEKGYYITPGIKFGGDFLIYLGDPVAFHAIYIVRCVEDPTKTYHTSEIVAFGRLGTSVKKRAVLASLSSDGSVSYITLSWLDT